MSSVCSNASWKTWTPLPDRFIDEHLVEMFRCQLSFDGAIRVNLPQQFFKPDSVHGLFGNSAMHFFAPYPFSCLSTLIKTRSSAENTMFIVYANCLQVTSDCSKQRCIGNRDILSSVFEY